MTVAVVIILASLGFIRITWLLMEIVENLEKIHDELACINHPMFVMTRPRGLRYDTTSKQASTQTGGVSGKDA